VQELTPDGKRILADVARQNEVSLEAVVTLLRALVAGNGSQAQFNHPELGGMGQWTQGGMIMVGDMFNQGLKYRVDKLCSELANLLRAQPLFMPSGSWSQSQSQGSGGVSLFFPGSGSPSGRWWPEELGDAVSTGAQNNLQYAYFPNHRRLAIQQGGRVRVYDTGDHLITGFSQQQSGDQSLTFTSQLGIVRVAELPLAHLVETERQTAEASPASTAQTPPSVTPPSSVGGASTNSTVEQFRLSGTIDIFATIERLAELRQKGILTEDEFAAKKTELLGRL